MATRNAAFVLRLFNRYNARYRARVARRLCDVGMVHEIAAMVASYANDDEQILRKHNDLVARLNAVADPFCHRMATVVSKRENNVTAWVTAVVIRLQGSPIMWVINERAVAAAEMSAAGSVKSIENSEDDKYAIDIAPAPAPTGTIGSYLIGALSNCGGRFDEYGNLWI